MDVYDSRANLADLVRAFEGSGDGALELRARFVRHTQRLTRSYPDAYFELGRKSPEAVEALADRAFTVCARVDKGRFPFQGRRPFACFVEERFDDPPIRYHGFYSKLSITRELLRDDYAHNLRRDPVLRWRDELHRAVGRVLRDEAQAVDAGPGAHKRWTLPGLRPVLHAEEVARRLRQQGVQSVREATLGALRLLGQPIAHSRLSNLVAEVLPAPAVEEPVAPSPHLDDLLALREVVWKAWEELSPEEQALLRALARGDDYEALLDAAPAFRNKVAISRAVSRCSQHFVGRIAEALGQPASATGTPKALMEAILLVLWPLVEAA